jgi:hypothetical protein
MIKLSEPETLANVLVDFFPIFSEELADEEISSYHVTFMLFAPISAQALKSADDTTIRRFCDLINQMVSAGGVLENAVSTCFFEHASQIGVRNIIGPFLSREAKAELR